MTAFAWRGNSSSDRASASLRLGRASGSVSAHPRRPAVARLEITPERLDAVAIALTRFDGLGSMLGAIPFGVTIPEMSALIGAVGCQRALMPDGGISAQLAVASQDETRRERIGLRKVPLGIVGVPR